MDYISFSAPQKRSTSARRLLKKLAERITNILPEDVSLNKVDLWFQDESRIGQQGSLTRIWAIKGTRPRVVRQQQFLFSYIFGAVCPSQKKCAGIVVPCANGFALEEH